MPYEMRFVKGQAKPWQVLRGGKVVAAFETEAEAKADMATRMKGNPMGVRSGVSRALGTRGHSPISQGSRPIARQNSRAVRTVTCFWSFPCPVFNIPSLNLTRASSASSNGPYLLMVPSSFL